MQVPFLDLRVQHEPLMPELVDAFRQVTETSAFAGGPFVARFETEFAAFCQTRHALGVGSGTDALWLSLLALGVGQGDEVITVPNSFMATAEAISLCGARPVFVDIDERTYTMDPAQLEAAITLRTQAIVPVHIFGQMADMDAILAIARRHGTPVVEDACQAHGAEYKAGGRAAWEWLAASASIRGRIWVRSARREPSPQTTRNCGPGFRRSATTGRRGSICTRPSAGTPVWTASRRQC